MKLNCPLASLGVHSRTGTLQDVYTLRWIHFARVIDFLMTDADALTPISNSRSYTLRSVPSSPGRSLFTWKYPVKWDWDLNNNFSKWNFPKISWNGWIVSITNDQGSICGVIPFGRKHHYHRILSSNCPSEAPPAIVGKAALFFFRKPDFSAVFFSELPWAFFFILWSLKFNVLPFFSRHINLFTKWSIHFIIFPNIGRRRREPGSKVPIFLQLCDRPSYHSPNPHGSSITLYSRRNFKWQNVIWLNALPLLLWKPKMIHTHTKQKGQNWQIKIKSGHL